MLRTRRRNKITRPGGRPHAQTVGLNAETRGGIEPMGKIFLLTFLFIGLPDGPSAEPPGNMGEMALAPVV